jgi:hypothetical protein
VAIYYHEMFLRDRPDMCNGMTAGGSGPEDDDTLMNNAAMTMAQNDSLITLSILQQQQQMMMMMACGSVGSGNLIQQQQTMAQAQLQNQNPLVFLGVHPWCSLVSLPGFLV